MFMILKTEIRNKELILNYLIFMILKTEIGSKELILNYKKIITGKKLV